MERKHGDKHRSTQTPIITSNIKKKQLTMNNIPGEIKPPPTPLTLNF